MLKNKKFYLTILSCALIAIFSYLFVRIYLVIASSTTLVDWIFASILLFAESFILIHTIGYFLNLFRVINLSESVPVAKSEIKLDHYPPVAIAVASYKEPLKILQETLTCFYNLSYPNKHLYFLDDTRYDLPFDTPENKLKYRHAIEELCQFLDINLFRANWHGAKAGIINDFLKHLNGVVQDDFEFYPAYSRKEHPTEKYLIIFDADMNPFPDFVEQLVDIMEKNPKVAFTQTPQYYSNFEFNRVARASGLQQAVFYEYICEGKNLQGAMFCCGTNVIYRREALDSIGGFDETSVTEDFTTSLKFHKLGWKSIYLNKVSAFGQGPESLGSFFSQQFRWARGTLGVLKIFPKELFLNYNKYTGNQWWEYFLASSHYLIGTVFFIMVLFPIIYIYFNIPSYFADPAIYLSFFLPYITLSLSMFIISLKKRNYRAIDVFFILMINAVTFPIFIKAAISSLFGIKSKFVTTPKEGTSTLSLWSLWPQIVTGLACISAVIFGILRIYYEREPFYGILFNVFWSLYNFSIISLFLYFNHSEETSL